MAASPDTKATPPAVAPTQSRSPQFLGIIQVPGVGMPDLGDITGPRHPMEALSLSDSATTAPPETHPPASSVTPTAETAARPSVLVVYTGGTMGMTRNEATGAYEPDPSFLETQLERVTPREARGMPGISFVALGPPLDSSDMNHTHWQLIAEAIALHYAKFDGFVVIHGTDTMAYSASALSFALENLAKPVVVTGAQIPFSVVRSDAMQNLVDSLLVAAYSKIPEVMIVFDSKVMRGNRTTKVQSWGISAFKSHNFPLLGEGGVRLVVFGDRQVRRPLLPFNPRPHFCGDVVVMPAFPGIERYAAGMLEAAEKSGARGLVLEAFGSGTAPAYRTLMQALEKACSRGMVVVIVSRCPAGSVALGSYSGGYSLGRAGCISGHDMTTESAFTKLSWLLAQEPAYSVPQIRSLMEEDLRGEVTKGFLVHHNRNHSVIF
jgi:L-asparaginase